MKTSIYIDKKAYVIFDGDNPKIRISECLAGIKEEMHPLARAIAEDYVRLSVRYHLPMGRLFGLSSKTRSA